MNDARPSTRFTPVRLGRALTVTGACVAMLGFAIPVTVPFTGGEGATSTDSGLEQEAGCTVAGCHSDLRERRVVHQPVAQGQCETCHVSVSRGTPFSSGPRHQFERAGDNPDLCYSCHENQAVEAHVHEPVAQGLCILCHDPHGAEYAFLTRVATDRELCAQCHRVTFDDADLVHGPVTAGACGACHDPHASPVAFRMRGEGDLQCGVCHLTDMNQVLTADHVHDPVGQACSNCHEPHAGTNPFRLMSSPPQLCLDCHEDLQQQIAQGAVVHAPVQQGLCLDCHEHHSSDYPRSLRREFTDSLYEPFAVERYELCLGCHPKELVLDPLTTEATNFRNGEVNLHFKHVNQEKKGRTCNVCHQPHASQGPALTRPASPFGAWEVPLALERTATGGSCATGCHPARAYDRIEPVVNQ